MRDRCSPDRGRMGVSVHYRAVPPSSALFNRLQNDGAFVTLMAVLSCYGEIYDAIDDLMESCRTFVNARRAGFFGVSRGQPFRPDLFFYRRAITSSVHFRHHQGNTLAQQNRKFTVVLEPEEEGGFTVRVPSLPEIVTYGENEQEALAMAEDAIRLVIEDCISRGEPIPAPPTPRIREITVTLAA
jgi:antitoxin HicB